MKPAVLLFALVPTLLLAQQGTQPQPGEPIDFMTIVIEGKETLNLPKSLLKVAPQLPAPYDSVALDSINPLEKVPLFRSSPPEQPRHIVLQSNDKLTLEASAGLYGFATIAGHLQTPVAHYTLDLDALLDRGGDYVPNADYLRTRLHAITRTAYQTSADQPYTVNSGEFLFDHHRYQLFAQATAPQRSLRRLSLAIAQQGTLGERSFNATLGIRNTHLTHTDSISTDESELGGTVRVDALHLDEQRIEAMADLSYRNYRGTALHFHTIGLIGHRDDSTLALRATLAAQIATTSWRSTEFSPRVEIGATWRTFESLWLDASLSTGMEVVRFAELSAESLYITDTAAIGVRRASYRVGITATYAPTDAFMVELSAAMASFADAPFLETLPDATMAPFYAAQLVRSADLRFQYIPASSNHIAATVHLRDAQFSDGSRVPYQPILRATVEYGRAISDRLIGSVQCGYVSTRLPARSSTSSLGGFFLLGAHVEYQLSPMIAITATFDNLLGSIYERWLGYRERGSFVGIGAIVRL
ncbi:MAG: hypothetical protein KatS3mg039_0978 [Candidatus Kapaibacterium sp.]|nr:MAG: hypothetical protein KatS3mg039_0978 [Candidatus Kapabacteria bacterium]